MSRTTEFVLGLLGGIFGIFAAGIALFVGGLDSVLNETGESAIINLGWFAVLFSILAIIGSVVVKSKPKLGGSFMLIAAIGGFICTSAFYILPGILLLIAGLMGLLKKNKKLTPVT